MPTSSQPNSGCFSGMFRRLLCTGNLPTHPSDALNEPQLKAAEAKLGARAAEPGPGVVARLMGLSSLPDANWVPNHRAPGAVPRSKSVNFADYLLHFDSSQAHHRRVQTSASFREVPPLNPRNDFLVLYMKDYSDGYAAEIESNLKEPETHRLREAKQGKELQSSNVKKNNKNSRMTKRKENARNEFKISKLKNEPRREIGKNFSKNRKCSSNKDSVSVLLSCKYKQRVPKIAGAAKSPQKKPAKQKEVAIGTEAKKKIKKNYLRHVGTKPDPDNSSPISVLDDGGFEFSDERSSPEMERGSEKCQNAGDRSEEEVGRICRLAEEDIREANWSVKNVWEFEAMEELCMELERHVVNVLLVQTLDDLV